MKRLLLAVSVGSMLACGGWLSSARKSAERKIEQKKREAVAHVKKEVGEAIEREVTEYMVEQGLDAELFEIGEDGFELKTDELDVQTGPDAKIPESFPLAPPDGAPLTAAGTADSEQGRTSFVLAEPAEREGLEAHYRELLESDGWEIQEPGEDAAPPEGATMLMAMKGEEKVVVYIPDEGSMGLVWMRPTE